MTSTNQAGRLRRGDGSITSELVGRVLIATITGAEHGVFTLALADELHELVDRAEADPRVGAVVLTGAHPERFISHADIGWLQEGGAASPKVGRATAAVISRVAMRLGRIRVLIPVLRRTPLWGAVQLGRLHHTLLRMNASEVVFVAALNGSALGFGAELAWACDARVMVDQADVFIGQPEVLLGFNPGGGGTQRLSRLLGPHRALVAMLEGSPLSASEAVNVGAVDDLAPRDRLLPRSLELAERLASRPGAAIGAIKRSVYFGASMSLPDGLHVERTEFLSVLPGDAAQDLMKSYRRATDGSGELPLYRSASYAEALRHGSFHGVADPNRSVS